MKDLYGNCQRIGRIWLVGFKQSLVVGVGFGAIGFKVRFEIM